MPKNERRRTVPLPLYPNFKILSEPGVMEYRYYKQPPERTGYYILGLDALAVLSLSYLYNKFNLKEDTKSLVFIVLTLLSYIYTRCTGIIYESVLLFPPHGIQLETHKGPFGPLFASRKFIPSDYFLDIIMNEGLRRWNVRYYLAAMVESPEHNLKLVVAFENLLPHFPVLNEVYQGIRSTFFRKQLSSSNVVLENVK